MKLGCLKLGYCEFYEGIKFKRKFGVRKRMKELLTV